MSIIADLLKVFFKIIIISSSSTVVICDVLVAV